MKSLQIIFLISTLTGFTTACQWTMQRIPDDDPKPGSYKNAGKVLLNRECDLGNNKYSVAPLDLNLCVENKDGKLVAVDNGKAFASCDVYTCLFGDNNSIECADCGQANGKTSISIDAVAKAVGKNGENAACFGHTVTATTSTFTPIHTGSH